MSLWTQIHGIIVVSPTGRTQAEKRYVLDTVLNHLPVVTGSEGSMNVYVNQINGHDSSSSTDEYGERTSNLIDCYGGKSFKNGWLRTQSKYIISIADSFRDREFEETFHEFVKWIVRLGKRISIEYIDVVVSGVSMKKGEFVTYRIEERDGIYTSGYFHKLCDWNDDEPRWIDHLLWKPAKDSWMPAELMYKYYSDEENDKRVETYLGKER